MHRRLLTAIDVALSRHIPVALLPSTTGVVPFTAANHAAGGRAGSGLERVYSHRSWTASLNLGNASADPDRAKMSQQYAKTASNRSRSASPNASTANMQSSMLMENGGNIEGDVGTPTADVMTSSVYRLESNNNKFKSSAPLPDKIESIRPNSATATQSANARHRTVMKEAQAYVKRGGFKMPAQSESQEFVQALVTTAQNKTNKGTAKRSSAKSSSTSSLDVDKTELSPYHLRRLVGSPSGQQPASGRPISSIGKRVQTPNCSLDNLGPYAVASSTSFIEGSLLRGDNDEAFMPLHKWKSEGLYQSVGNSLETSALNDAPLSSKRLVASGLKSSTSSVVSQSKSHGYEGNNLSSSKVGDNAGVVIDASCAESLQQSRDLTAYADIY